MKRKLWKQKWFILVCLWSVFFALTATRVLAAGTDIQLEKVLKAGVDGLTAYFNFLLDVLNKIW